jgi:fumarate reductase flavoprotein subunit
MNRGISLAIVCVTISLLQAVVFHALAQTPPTPAPGVGHGFLIDKHVAAGLTCNKCHTESTAKAPETATCLSCHGGTYAKLAAMTNGDQPNPHASHQGDLPCAQCHHVHMKSVTMCNKCHTYDMTTP